MKCARSKAPRALLARGTSLARWYEEGEIGRGGEGERGRTTGSAAMRSTPNGVVQPSPGLADEGGQPWVDAEMVVQALRHGDAEPFQGSRPGLLDDLGLPSLVSLSPYVLSIPRGAFRAHTACRPRKVSRDASPSLPLSPSPPLSSRAAWRSRAQRRCRAQRVLPRSGYTLLEILVASALTLFLISAVYTGVRMYWRYSASGHDEVERALLARALLKRIEMDVRSVMFRPPPPASSSTSSQSSSGSGSSSSGSSSGSSSSSSSSNSSSSGSSGSNSSGSSSSSGSGSSSSSSSSSTQTSAPEDLYNTSNTGLFGNTTTLLMHCSKPGRERMPVQLIQTGVARSPSDVATVSYFVAGTATGVLQHVVSGQGLARLEGDRLALAMADQQSSVALMAAQTQILAPEVSAIQFRYYDGLNSSWRLNWDSSVMGALPRAIEVTMQLRPMPGHAAAASSNTYRLVIAIPLGTPIDTSQVQ